MPLIAQKHGATENPFAFRAAAPQSDEGQKLWQARMQAEDELKKGVAGQYLNDPGVVPAGGEQVTVQISPLSFLRTAALIAWHSFRHPFTTTYIDFERGDCVQK